MGSCKITYGNKRFNSKQELKEHLVEEISSGRLDIDSIGHDVFGFPVHRPREDKYRNQITRLENEVSLLYDRLKDKSSRRDELLPEIQRIEDLLDKLKAKRSENVLLNIANIQLKETENKVATLSKIIEEGLKTKDEEALISLLEKVDESGIFAGGWTQIDQMIENPKSNPDVDIEVAKYKKLASDLVNKVRGLKRKLILELANKLGAKDAYSEQELFDYGVDINRINAAMLNAHLSEDELVKVTAQVLELARFRSERAFTKQQRSIEDLIQRNQKMTGKKGSDAWDWMIQTDSEGKKTGRFVGEYSLEFDRFIEELEAGRDAKLKAAKDSAELRNQIWKEYWKTLQEEVNIMSYPELTSGKSDRFTKEEMDKQEELRLQYVKDKEGYRNSLELSGLYNVENGRRKDDPRLTEEENDALFNSYVVAVNRWISKNSPLEYLRMIAGETKFIKGARGYQYLIPMRPKDKWKDKAYEKFTPEQRAIYSEFMDHMGYYNSLLPKHRLEYKKYKTGDIIPELEAKKANIFNTSVKHWPKFLWEAMSEEDSTFFDPSIVFEEDSYIREIKQIPITMLGKKLSPEEKSYDLGKVLLAYSHMALSYNEKSKIESFATNALELLKVKPNASVSKTGGVFRTDRHGGAILKDKTVETSVKQLEYNIDYMLYGKTRNTMELSTGRRTFSAKDEKKLKAMGLTPKQAREEINKIHKDFRKGTITYEEYKSSLKKYEGIGRVITGGKIGDSLLTYTYIKALSFPNLVAPAVNLTFGLISNLVYSAGGIDFDTKTALQGLGVVTSALMTGKGDILIRRKNIDLLYAWMCELNLIGDINESKYGQGLDWTHKVTILQMAAEKMNQGSVMVAMLKYNKLKDKSGKDIAIWDAYKVDEKGVLVWDTETMGEEGEINPKAVFHPTNNSVNIYRLSEYVKAVVERIHGDYNHPLWIKKSILGRAFMLFRTWLPQTFYERFGKETRDDRLGRMRKGRYRSYKAEDESGYDINIGKTIGKVFARIFYLGNNFSNYSELDKENLRRNVAELRAIIVVAMVGLVLRGLAEGGDDDDEAKAILNTVVNTHGKILADLAFFLNPKSSDQVAKNILPLWNTMSDLLTIWPATVRMIQGDPYYHSGPWKGQHMYWKWLMINLPLTNAASRMWNYKEQIYRYN